MLDAALLNNIHWREPLWLLFAILGPFLLLLLRQAGEKKYDCYADRALQPWVRWPSEIELGKRYFLRGLLFVVSWVLMSISLAGPRSIEETGETSRQPDVDIMIVLDASRSMRATDVKPDRFSRAGIEIAEFMQRTRHARLGVILYTSTAHLLVPLTQDHETVAFYLRQLDRIPMPTRGSRPLEAFTLARSEIESTTKNTDSAILWITDGDPAGLGNEYLEQLNAFVRGTAASIPLYILGIGSVEGEAIPLETGWLEIDGRPVISRMNEQWLTGLAASGNGNFTLVQPDDADWRHLFDTGLMAQRRAGSKMKDDQHTVWNELYHWTLIPAIILLLLSLSPHRIRRLEKQFPALLLPAVMLLFIGDNQGHASTSNESEKLAQQAYHDGHFDKAARYYSTVQGYTGHIGTGNSYYRSHDYQQAADHYRQAVIAALDDQQRGTAIYNLANAIFMQGDYQSASRLYRDALLYRPQHEKSRINLRLSQVLQQQVEQQLDQALAGRMGSGPSSRRAAAGLDVNESGSLSLDSNDDTDRGLAIIPGEQLELLIARGIEHAHIASLSRDGEAGLSSWQQESSQAKIRMRELRDQQALLWKRLFEMEDGFPAALEEAKQLPGIYPW